MFPSTEPWFCAPPTREAGKKQPGGGGGGFLPGAVHVSHTFSWAPALQGLEGSLKEEVFLGAFQFQPENIIQTFPLQVAGERGPHGALLHELCVEAGPRAPALSPACSGVAMRCPRWSQGRSCASQAPEDLRSLALRSTRPTSKRGC